MVWRSEVAMGRLASLGDVAASLAERGGTAYSESWYGAPGRWRR